MKLATGTSLPDLANSLGRLLPAAAGNSAKALHELRDAQDVALGRHIDLASAANTLARAEAGSDTALRRLGIILPKIHTEQAAVTKEHQRAIESGIRFTAATNSQYQAALRQAKALDAQATHTRLLEEVQHRFGGQTARFAASAEGQYARFRQSLHNLLGDIGSGLLPGLAAGAEHVRLFIEELRRSGEVQDAVDFGVRELTSGYHFLRAAVEALEPPLRVVARLSGDVLDITGVGGLLAFAGGFKAITLATSLAGAARKRYQTIIAAGIAAESGAAKAAAGEAAAYAELTAAISANTQAVGANTIIAARLGEIHAANAAAIAAAVVPLSSTGVALDREISILALDTAALEANTAAIEVFASTRATASGIVLASNVRSVAAAGEEAAIGISKVPLALGGAERAAASFSARLATVGRGLFALGGGWTTVAAVGVGALAFGLYKLATADSNVEQANNELFDSLQRLGTGLNSTRRLAAEYQTTLDSIKSDKVAVEVAKANLEVERQRFAMLAGKKGTAEYAQALASLHQAELGVQQAIKAQTADETKASSLRRRSATEEAKISRARDSAIEHTLGLARELRQTAIDVGTQAAGAGANIAKAIAQGGLQQVPARFAAQLEKDAKALREQHPLLARQEQLLAAVARATNRIPTRHQIEVVLNAGNARQGLLELVELLRATGPSARAFSQTLEREARNLDRSNPQLAERLRLLADYAQRVHRIPTRKETELALKPASFEKALAALADALLHARNLSGEGGTQSGREFVKKFTDQFTRGGLLGPISFALSAVAKTAKDSTKEVIDGIKDASKAERDAAVASRNAAGDTAKKLAQQARDAAETARNAARDVADAQRDLAQTIRDGNEQIRSAILGAEQNLFSIGSSLEDAIDQLIDAQKRSSDAVLAGTPAAKEFKRIRDEIAKGEATPELERRARALAQQLQEQQSIKGDDVEQRKQRVRREINDLIDEFNKGSITLREFNKKIANLLAREHLSYRAAGKVLGVAFADGFRAEVQGLKAQAIAIAKGPRIKGATGLEPNIVRPLQVLHDTQERIAQAQQRRDDALLTETKAEHKLDALQERHQAAIKALTTASNRSESLTEQHTRYLAAKARRDEARDERRHNENVRLQRRHNQLLQTIANEGVGQRKPPDARGRPTGRAARDAQTSGSKGLRP